MFPKSTAVARFHKEEVESKLSHKFYNNFDVDYVITYRFKDPSKKKHEIEATFVKLITTLENAELYTTVREGANSTLLVFVKANKTRLIEEVYYSRVKDWLHGVYTAGAEQDSLDSISSNSLTEAERLRNIYCLIAHAGITPRYGEWKAVESIFPLHDHDFNKSWISSWSEKDVLGAADLIMIKDQFGPMLTILTPLWIAHYFAFLQSYCFFLLLPATLGCLAWLCLGHFSPAYAVFNCLWCVVFTEYCNHDEHGLTITWGVLDADALKLKTPDLKTGKISQVYSAIKRLSRCVLHALLAILLILVLGILIGICFAAEVFIEEIYDGPLKNILIYLPMSSMALIIPLVQNNLFRVSNSLENYKTKSAHEVAVVQKTFIIDFVISILPIFFAAFFYIPYGSLATPYINNVIRLTDQLPVLFGLGESKHDVINLEFVVNPRRLKNQIICFAVISEFGYLMNEMVIPFFKREGSKRLKQFRDRKQCVGAVDTNTTDCPEEAAFLTKVRKEAILKQYDVNTDFQKMCKQFSYLALFSCVCPLISVVFLIGGCFKLRSDAMRISHEMKRPIPCREDSIRPWLHHLSFVAWLCSISSAALVYSFSGNDLTTSTALNIESTRLMTAIVLSEYLYFITRCLVRQVFQWIRFPGMKKDHAEKHSLRKQLLDESFAKGSTVDEAITKLEAYLNLGEEVEKKSGNLSARRRFWLK